MRPGIIASAKVAAAAGNQAVRFNATGQKLSRVATGLSQPFTFCCWVNIRTDRNVFGCAMGADNGTTYADLGVNATGTTNIVFTSGGDAAGVDQGAGVWWFIAYVSSTGASKHYYGNAAASTLSVINAATVTLAGTETFALGTNGFNDWINGSVAAVKVWTAALTQVELEAEKPKYAAQRASGLWAAYSFRNGVQTTDDSGNGRTLTQTGTPIADTSGPPIT